jgi:DNA-binding CsgD family transcriptional regulator/N-acetylneuraminic acid mutarotase
MNLPGTNDLSERELDILRLLATGVSNKEIAAQLYISSNTVKVHLRNIFAKIGVGSRTEAAMYAVRVGLVQSPIPALGVLPGPSRYEEKARSSGVRQIWKRHPRAMLISVSALLLILLTGAIVALVRRPAASGIVSKPLVIVPAGDSHWQVLAAMPTGRKGMAVATFENRLYAIGGEATQGVTGVVECYDPAMNVWSERAPKPLSVADIGAATVGGVIYVPGGRTPSGEMTNVLEVYDPLQDQWEQRAALPVALSGYALAALEGRVYLFGGTNGHDTLDTVYVYDPSRDNWSKLTSMPTRRAYAGAAVAGERIYVIGGFDGKQALVTNEVFSPHLEGREQPWSQAAPMPFGRYPVGVASVADSVYVLGGERDSPSSLTSIVYLLQTDEWQAFESPPVDLGKDARLVPLGNYIYIIGGQTTSGTGYTLSYQAIYTVVIPLVP